jgi:hypothetical protein
MHTIRTENQTIKKQSCVVIQLHNLQLEQATRENKTKIYSSIYLGRFFLYLLLLLTDAL